MAVIPPNASRRALDLYNKGARLVRHKSYGLALEYFALAVNDSPEFYQAWLNKGSAHYTVDEFDEALRSFSMALSLAPTNDNADILSNMGAALFKLKRYDESVIFFKKALDTPINSGLASWRSFVLNWLAWVLTHKGNHEEALELAKRSISEDPNNTNAIDTKGLILYKLGMNEEALEIFNKAIGANGANKYAWYNKGNLQLRLSNLSDALRCYEKALELDPNFAEAHNGKGMVLYYKKNYEDAASEFGKAIELKPDLSSAHENVAKAVSGKSSRKGFLEFWSATRTRLAIAVSLTIFALGLVLLYPVMASYLPMYAANSTVIETITTSSGSTTTTTSTTSFQMPQYYLVAVGLAILLLLMPEVKSLKIGPFEFERLADPEPAEELPIK